jgi:hypothetical protein
MFRAINKDTWYGFKMGGENACVIHVEKHFILEHKKSIKNSSTETRVTARL